MRLFEFKTVPLWDWCPSVSASDRKLVIRIGWIFALIAVALGGIGLLASVGEKGAPQQGAAAAIAIGFAVIPYCFMRGCQFISDPHGRELREIRELLEVAHGVKRVPIKGVPLALPEKLTDGRERCSNRNSALPADAERCNGCGAVLTR